MPSIEEQILLMLTNKINHTQMLQIQTINLPKLDYENNANIYRDYVSKFYKECFLSFLSKQFCKVRSVCKVWSVASLISYLNKDYNFSSFYDHSFFPTLKLMDIVVHNQWLMLTSNISIKRPDFLLVNTSNTWGGLISFLSVLVLVSSHWMFQCYEVCVCY